MSDFIRQTTEQLAQDGFVAIAPDLLSRRGGTPPSPDSARKLIAGLHPDTVTRDLDATVAYVRGVKAVRPDRIGVIGFCWGGGQRWRTARGGRCGSSSGRRWSAERAVEPRRLYRPLPSSTVPSGTPAPAPASARSPPGGRPPSGRPPSRASHRAPRTPSRRRTSGA